MEHVIGHSKIGGEFYHFPHECPGAECAIARWLRREIKVEGKLRKKLRPELVAEQLEAKD